MSTTDPAAGLAAAIEVLLFTPQGSADCAPIMFGHWPGGKPLDEWFTADAVSVDGHRLQVYFDDGADILTIEYPGRWCRGENSVVVADAQRVSLRTHRTYPQLAHLPGAPRTFSRTMDYRTEPGVVVDRDGRRVRWYPPDAPSRARHVGASRAPALELQLLRPLIEGARLRG